METCCSFKSLSNGQCGVDRKESNIVPLLSCTKSIASHRTTLKFDDTISEIELILARVAIFDTPKDINKLTICPKHRFVLGLGWSRGGNSRCRVLEVISGHGKRGRQWPQAEKGLCKDDSMAILKTTGLFIPVGSGMLLFFK